MPDRKRFSEVDHGGGMGRPTLQLGLEGGNSVTLIAVNGEGPYAITDLSDTDLRDRIDIYLCIHGLGRGLEIQMGRDEAVRRLIAIGLEHCTEADIIELTAAHHAATSELPNLVANDDFVVAAVLDTIAQVSKTAASWTTLVTLMRGTPSPFGRSATALMDGGPLADSLARLRDRGMVAEQDDGFCLTEAGGAALHESCESSTRTDYRSELKQLVQHRFRELIEEVREAT